MPGRSLIGFVLGGMLTACLVTAAAAIAMPASTIPAGALPTGAVPAGALSVLPLSGPRADADTPTITDLGPIGNPVGVNSSAEVALFVGAVWKNGVVTIAQAPQSDPSATFYAQAINDSGVVVGYTSTGLPAYWDTATSTTFTEVPVSGLTVNGQPATGGMFVAIDDAGDAVGNVWNSSGGMGDSGTVSNNTNNSGLFASGSGGAPTGAPTVVASVDGSSIYSLDGINSLYEDANMSEDRPELLITRSSQTVTATNIYEQEGTPVSMASNGTITGAVLAQNSETLTLRLASGAEQSLGWPSGYSGPVVSVNASGTSVGWVYPISGPSNGALPVIWNSGGDGQFLLPEIPDSSDWTNVSPVAINDQGFIVGYGSYNGSGAGFLISTPVRVPPVVNSTGDAPAADPSSGSCDTGSTVADALGQRVPECTLRAAIQTVDALDNKTAITFDIASSGTPSIAVGSVLPVITAAGTVVDGTSQSGGVVSVDGAGLGGKGDCLNVRAAEVTVQGMDLINCPTAVELQAPGDDKVQGNLIGVKADGTTPTEGGIGVLVDGGSSGNLIGGDESALGNVISDQGFGVQLSGPRNLVEGNLLGTDADGSGFIPDEMGVAAVGSGNTIGGRATTAGSPPGNVIVSGNVKSRFDYGVIVVGGSNTVQGNALGTNAAGDVYAPKSGYAAASNVLVAGGHALIGGASGFGNVIAGARASQVLIDGAGAGAAKVAGNRIGAGEDGEVLESKDAAGVMIAGANDAVIGADGDGNKITGQLDGVQISKDSQEIDYTVAETVDGVTSYQYYVLNGTDTPAKVTGATVKDNVIGPLPSGDRGPDTPETVGVLDDGGDEDLIGPRNVISWNATGIKLAATNKVQIEGNLIGTDTGGLDALPNGTGVWIDQGKQTQLGIAGEPDTISGNGMGVEADGLKTLIQAELIGPNSRGNAALKPFAGKLPAELGSRFGHGGIDVGLHAGVTVAGGFDTGDGVTIAGVTGTGFFMSGKAVLVDDRIGVGTNGHSVLANTGDGVQVSNANLALIVDSTDDHNAGTGVEEDGGGHAAEILGTTMYDNAKGGIAIHDVKAPEAPKITSAINAGHGTRVKLEFKVPAGNTGILQIFATPSCETHGAGKKQVDVVTDIHAGRHDDTTENLPDTEPVGTAITATLTIGSGGQLNELLEDDLHLSDGTTSEFSQCTTVKPTQ